MRLPDDHRRAIDDEPTDEDELDPDLELELDDEFPLGDGTAETDAVVHCPYCARAVEIALDPGSGAVQAYVEDCEVCCRPWLVAVVYQADGSADVSVSALDA
jgi:hypothetical protein